MKKIIAILYWWISLTVGGNEIIDLGSLEIRGEIRRPGLGFVEDFSVVQRIGQKVFIMQVNDFEDLLLTGNGPMDWNQLHLERKDALLGKLEELERSLLSDQ
jgi:hypothetical protein